MTKRKKSRKPRSSARIIGEALAGLVVVWRETLRRPRRRAVVAALALVFVVAMLVARIGTPRARIGAAGLLAAAAAGAVALGVRERRKWQDPRGVIQRLAGRADPDRAARALRALTLLGDDGEPKDTSTSPALARLHVARQLAALPHERILDEAARAARRAHAVAIALGLAVLGLGGSHAFSVIEGADVLVAAHGVAPLGLPYVGDLELVARPPDYLHQEERRRMPYGKLSLPRGTLLTFRGTAIHSGRRLVVTDGKNEVPFVDDGGGRVVARWPVGGSAAGGTPQTQDVGGSAAGGTPQTQDVGGSAAGGTPQTGDDGDTATLRVVARFGDVVLPEPDATVVTSIADQAPIVKLEGAPRTISLTSPEGQGEIPIRYEATDDHGLREVQLVLTSGTREERRVLARLDGETRSDRGGSVLRPKDSFVRHSHAPVLVRVEAKDNDPITGPKWGASESITLLPPDIGEAEADRLDALRALRDAYVDALAWRMENAIGRKNAGGTTTTADDDKRVADEVARKLDDALTGRHGTALPGRLVALLRAHQKKIEDARAAERRAPGAGSHGKTVKTTETMVLVVDGIVRGLERKDARAASKQLADVADDLARGYGDARSSSSRAKWKTRTDAATHVLRGGEKQLARLGVLGHDLSGAVHAGLGRTTRAEGGGDLQHAELAARDLAVRLRDADPSFGSRGGSGGHAGGESGGEPGTSSGEGGDEPSEAEKAFNEAVQDLEQLDEDHSGAMGDVDQALSKGLSKEDLKKLQDDAKPHAAAVRDAVKDLPSVGGGSDTWSSKGAGARELAEQMAHSLEGGSIDDAVQSGHQALQNLDEAKRIAARERYRLWDDPSADDGTKKLDDAKKKLEPEVQWAEKQLEHMKKQAAEHARGDLQRIGGEEAKLAERARKLAQESGDRGSLPEPAVDALEAAKEAAQQAADSLQHGDAESGRRKQQEAQQKLDEAKQAVGDQSDDAPESDSGDGRAESGGQADIPKADAHKGPEEFRKRVLHGLSEPSSSKHKDAITRYAEGLLR